MKKLILIFTLFALVSCVGMQSATSYHYVPKLDKDECVGSITYIVEKSGFSIITVEKSNTIIYVCGRLNDIKKPYLSQAYILEQNDIKHFVYENKRYLIDVEKSSL